MRFKGKDKGKKISMKTGRMEKNRRGMEEDTWKKVPVGEKHLRLIIDHLSNEASSRGLSSKSLCAAMFPTVENPPCVVADVRCFFLDSKCRRREVLFRFNDTLSHTSVAMYTRPMLIPFFSLLLFPDFRFHSVSFAVTNHRLNQSRKKLLANAMARE